MKTTRAFVYVTAAEYATLTQLQVTDPRRVYVIDDRLRQVRHP